MPPAMRPSPVAISIEHYPDAHAYKGPAKAGPGGHIRPGALKGP
jgi:hypothetical protein